MPIEMEVSTRGARHAGLYDYLNKLAESAETSEAGPGASIPGPSYPQAAETLQAAEELKLEARTVRPFVEIGGNLICRYYQVTELTDTEAGELAEATAAVVNKWAPAALLHYQEEVALASVILALAIARLPEYASRKRQERELAEEGAELAEGKEVSEEEAAPE